jgi:hypothetical protein
LQVESPRVQVRVLAAVAQAKRAIPMELGTAEMESKVSLRETPMRVVDLLGLVMRDAQVVQAVVARPKQLGLVRVLRPVMER